MPSQNNVWSPKLDRLFSELVVQPVMDANRFGIPHSHVYETVLEKGRTDFSKPFASPQLGDLTPMEKCLLYCFNNMRGHFYSSKWMFENHETELPIECWKEKPVLVDIGSGPATSALAFAEAFPGWAFDYVAIDSANSMLLLARSFFSRAQRNGIITPDSEYMDLPCWTDLPAAQFSRRTLIFNFAFFFSSTTLVPPDIHSLATAVYNAMTIDETNTFISYTNTDVSIAHRNYKAFVRELGLTSGSIPIETVKYKNRRNQDDLKKQSFAYDFFGLLNG